MTNNDLYELYIADVIHEEIMLERMEKMERKIIDLKDIYLSELDTLYDYVWKGTVLIPVELIYGE